VRAKTWAFGILLYAAAAPAGGGPRAAEVTRVVSGSSAKGKLFDFNLTASFFRQEREAAILREFEDQTTGGKAIVTKDLVLHETRNVLGLRADFGLIHDVGVFVSTPLVLSHDRSLAFDRSHGECKSLMPGAASPNCVNETSSTFLRDGILPGAGAASYGWDAAHDRRFERPSEMLFRGPTRKGLEHLGLGLQGAIMNQTRDDTKPTWMARAELRLSVGDEMGFDIDSPRANTAVGLGYHQLVLGTAFSRRFSRLDPYLGAFYNIPLVPSGSRYKRYPLGRFGFDGPQHRAGVEAGSEAVLWEDARARQRVTFELRGRLELRYFGLARGELWEPLSGSAKCPAERLACRRDLDRDLDGDGAVDPNPGLTRSPSYGVVGGEAGLNVQVGRYVRFRGLAGLEREQDRFLTDGRSGADVIDAPGRRFRVEGARSWHVYFEGGLMF
jgi:hypothetical protein